MLMARSGKVQQRAGVRSFLSGQAFLDTGNGPERPDPLTSHGGRLRVKNQFTFRSPLVRKSRVFWRANQARSTAIHQEACAVRHWARTYRTPIDKR
jgi:hypothetical protein